MLLPQLPRKCILPWHSLNMGDLLQPEQEGQRLVRGRNTDAVFLTSPLQVCGEHGLQALLFLCVTYIAISPQNSTLWMSCAKYKPQLCRRGESHTARQKIIDLTWPSPLQKSHFTKFLSPNWHLGSFPLILHLVCNSGASTSWVKQRAKAQLLHYGDPPPACPPLPVQQQGEGKPACVGRTGIAKGAVKKKQQPHNCPEHNK